jgi:hypothetical protein
MSVASSHWSATGIRPAIVFLLGASIAGCGDGPPRPPEAPTRTESRTPVAATPELDAGADSAPNSPVISANGIGLDTRGTTVGDIRTAIPPTWRLGDVDERFMVDLSAIPVIAERDTLYHLLFFAGVTVDDATPLDWVATSHDRARTREGIGPGSTLREVEAVHGAITLAYSVNDESREYVSFVGRPENVLFRVGPGSAGGPFAGVYTTHGEYNSTSDYDPTARISMVLVNVSPGQGAPGAR